MRRHLASAAVAVVLVTLSRGVVWTSGAPPTPSPTCGDIARRPAVAFAVVGDGFTALQQTLLDRASATLVCGGAMIQETSYKTHPEQMLAETIHVTSPVEGVAMPGRTPTSALEVVYNGLRSDCYFTTSDRSLKKIADVAQQALHRQVLVIVNLPNQDAGCTEGGITFLTRGASWQTISHEIGHILGLRDEYEDRDGTDPDPLNRTNCSSTAAAWWLSAGALPGAGAIGGCDHFSSGAFRAYRDCRMRELANPLCLVCQRLIDERLATVHTASPAPPSGTQASVPMVQMAFRLQGRSADNTPPSIDVLSSADVTGPPPQTPVLAAGQHLGVVLVGGAIASVVDLSSTFTRDDTLVKRAYGGPTAGIHIDRPANQAVVFAAVPRFTKAALKTQALDFTVIRISGAPPPVITRQFLGSAGATAVFTATNLQSRIQ